MINVNFLFNPSYTKLSHTQFKSEANTTMVPELMKISHFFSYLSESKDQTIIGKVQMKEAIKLNEFRFKFLELVIWINLDSPSKARNQN